MFKKRILYLLILILFVIPLSSCSVLNNAKPNKFYYTNLLAKDLTNEKALKINIMDTNYYKQLSLSTKDNLALYDFLKSLKPNNFVTKPSALPAKAIYKIFIIIGKNEYIINVYTEKYLTIFPWDGDYEMDYIDMTGIYENYNIYNLCKFIYTPKEKWQFTCVIICIITCIKIAIL